MALVETKNANLNTLSVTIQALHVSGKQMTLAVFRQLPVLDETEEAVLWGVVRYDIKDQGDLWLVYSLNGCLYRRAINLTPYERTADFYDAQKYVRNAESSVQHYSEKLDRYLGYSGYDVTEIQCELDKAKVHLKAVTTEFSQREKIYSDKLVYEQKLAELTQLFIAV